MMIKLRRVLKGGFLNFTRGGLVSWAAVLISTITLSFVTGILLLQAVLNFSLDQIKNKVDVTIYFNVNAPESKILTLQKSIEGLPEVAEVTYVSAEESLKNFREKHENDYATIQALDELKDNPLGGYLNIKAKEISQYESIANFMKGDDALAIDSSTIVSKINYYQNKAMIEKLNNIIVGAKELGLLLTLILILISAIITFNTIRLTIFISKEEINVMRLVGASKMRVRSPFMVEGAMYGIVASIITVIIFLPITAYLGKNLTNFLGINVYKYYISNIFEIFGIILLSGVLLGMISSYLATKKYLSK